MQKSSKIVDPLILLHGWIELAELITNITFKTFSVAFSLRNLRNTKNPSKSELLRILKKVQDFAHLDWRKAFETNLFRFSVQMWLELCRVKNISSLLSLPARPTMSIRQHSNTLFSQTYVVFCFETFLQLSYIIRTVKQRQTKVYMGFGKCCSIPEKINFFEIGD